MFPLRVNEWSVPDKPAIFVPRKPTQRVPITTYEHVMTDAVEAEFEEHGPDRVRYSLYSEHYNSVIAKRAIAWLAKQDAVVSQRQAAEAAEQLRISKSGAKAAWWAVWLALAATIASLVAWLVPRPW